MKNLYEELGVKKILLVEDDPWTRKSLSLFFEFEGCSIRSAATAEEAITALSGGLFDLILCEHHLPGMNGLSLLKLFGNHQTQAVKILFTSQVTDHLKKEAVRCGVQEVLRKPFMVETLEESLRRHCTRSRRRDPEPIDMPL